MTLTLTIRNVGRLDNGMPTSFVLDRRGATVGRAPTCDWSLPDPHRYISSRHVEISFAGDAYLLTDTSTNGTFLNGATERMADVRRVSHGDQFQVGPFLIAAELSGAAAERSSAPNLEGAEAPGWSGWDSHARPALQPKFDDSLGHWADVPGGSDGSRAGPMTGPMTGSLAGSGAGSGTGSGDSASWLPPGADLGGGMRWGAPPATPGPAPSAGGWTPSQRAPDPPVASVWQDQMPVPDPASSWSSAAPDRPPAPSPDDVWGRIVEGNVVDWARSGFGRPEARAADPLGLNRLEEGGAAALPKEKPRPASFLAPSSEEAPAPAPSPAPIPAVPPARIAGPVPLAAPALAPAPASGAGPMPASIPAPGSGPMPTPVADAGDPVTAFLAAAELQPTDVTRGAPELLASAGALLRRLVAGLVVLVEARARAKAQMGAEGTRLELDGNNPIKFARSPEQALLLLLNPKERGFMDAERAIADSFYDLQSHQIATLQAMQGALKATLDRFSPDAIRRRAEGGGLLAKILPAARDAALWQNYEREFGGVAQGSDEAFMDVFAKEFRKAYEEQAERARR